MSWVVELRAAAEAVREACGLTARIQSRLASAGRLEKLDKSPVTVADFAAQALICRRLRAAFPADPVVGEEGAAALREDGAAALRAQVVAEVQGRLGEEVSEEDVLGWIDHGGHRSPAPRYWTLDPIDGTKGFLRGAHYAVGLALVEDGRVVASALGAPNLDGGQLFCAARGAGVTVEPLAGGGSAAVRVSDVSEPARLRRSESFEPGHHDRELSDRFGAALGIAAPPLRIDSMTKYALVARGDSELYLRVAREGYRENVWDHAAGVLVVEEAGGRATDLEGADLDFSTPPTLPRRGGILVSNGACHEAVLEALRGLRGSPPAGAQPAAPSAPYER